MWAQVLVAAAGVWLMAAPATLDFGRPAATNAWIVGPIVASLATIAIWGATRPVRWANVPLGAWLAAAPLLLTHPQDAAANSVVCGVLIAALSAVRGTVRHPYAGGWSYVWRGGAEGGVSPPLRHVRRRQ